MHLMRIACLAVAMALVGSPAAAQFCGVSVDCDWPVPDVGHWTFDDDIVSGTAGDRTGNGNVATWRGAPGDNVQVAGLIGAASQTNDENGGTDSYIISDLPQLDGATGYTVSIWFNQNVDDNNNNAQQGLFTSRSVVDSFGSNGFWAVNLDSNSSPRGFDARIGNNINGATRPGAGDPLPEGSTLPTDEEGNWTGIVGDVVDEWHHVAFTWNGEDGAQNLYYDGQLLGTGINTSTIGGSLVETSSASLSGGGPAGWFIGDDACCGNNRHFTGTLDDTAVWSSALSATDISQIYEAGLVGVNASLDEPPQPGDTDLDGDVDLDDVGPISQFFLQTGLTRAEGDLTGGGTVDWADFRQWKDNFPFTPSSAAASAAVPEPGSLALAAMFAAVFAYGRKRS